jgi:hypothetical protein
MLLALTLMVPRFAISPALPTTTSSPSGDESIVVSSTGAKLATLFRDCAVTAEVGVDVDESEADLPCRYGEKDISEGVEGLLATAFVKRRFNEGFFIRRIFEDGEFGEESSVWTENEGSDR